MAVAKLKINLIQFDNGKWKVEVVSKYKGEVTVARSKSKWDSREDAEAAAHQFFTEAKQVFEDGGAKVTEGDA